MAAAVICFVGIKIVYLKFFVPPLFHGFCIRVARWYIFKPKITSWVNFGGSCNGR
jgi:hypothetical protein